MHLWCAVPSTSLFSTPSSVILLQGDPSLSYKKQQNKRVNKSTQVSQQGQLNSSQQKKSQHKEMKQRQR